jgi:hypothetical protein
MPATGRASAVRSSRRIALVLIFPPQAVVWPPYTETLLIPAVKSMNLTVGELLFRLPVLR